MLAQISVPVTFICETVPVPFYLHKIAPNIFANLQMYPHSHIFTNMNICLAHI